MSSHPQECTQAWTAVAMAATVEIVAGPARSGKSAALVDRLRQDIETTRRQGRLESGILWIAPTVRAADRVRDHLLDDRVTACLGVSVQTFDQFADRIVCASDQEIRPISRVLQRWILRQLIDKAIEGNRFVHFASIAETDGFLDLVSDFVQEMKRREIWPDEFDAACQRTDWPHRGQDRNRELGWLYRNYQDLLNRYRLYDHEGRFWVARALLRDGRSESIAALRAVYVDGFTDFTRTQHEILVLLALHLEQLILSLPLEPSSDGQREDLFAKSIHTLQELQRRHEQVRIHFLTAGPASWPELDLIGRNLFRPPRQIEGLGAPGAAGEPPASRRRGSPVEPGSDPSPASGVPDRPGDEVPNHRLCVLRAANDVRELEVVAGQIKRCLTGGTVRPDEILVVVRSFGGLGPMLREVFTEYGIPFSMEERRPIAETALARRLIALLELDRDDWPFRPLLALITGWIQGPWHRAPRDPGALGRGWSSEKTHGTGSPLVSATAAERVVRHLQVGCGRDMLLDRVRQLADVDRSEIHAIPNRSTPLDLEDRMAPDARAALSDLESIAGILDDLPLRATPCQWRDALAQCAAQLGYRTAPPENETDSQADAETAAAWRAIEHELVSVERFLNWAGESTQRLDRARILELLRDIVRHATLPPEIEDIGTVRIVSAPTARALPVSHLFLVGMHEGTYPQLDGGNPLFSDADCAALVAAGLPFATRQERYADEMLLFYEIVMRAEQQIVLSYPGLDDRAAPLLPSPFLQDLVRLAGDRITFWDCRDLGPVDRRAEPVSPTEFRIRAVADALDGDSSRLAQLVAHGIPGPEDQRVRKTGSNAPRSGPPPVQNPVPSWNVGAHVDVGLRMLADRGRSDRFGPTEGVAAWSETRRALAEEFGPAHHWSPSRFEEYARCPFRFYLERILHLEPLDDLTLDTDPVRRGALAHAVWAEFHTRMRKLAGSRPLTTHFDRDAFQCAFQDIVDHMTENSRSQGVDRALWELDRRQILDWATDYYRQHWEYDQLAADFEQPFVPAHFEVRFGPAKTGVQDPDGALATPKALELRFGESTIRITGRMDRIDLGRLANRMIFNVIDYKTGVAKGITDEEIEQGVRLQGPLYALAVETLFFQDQDARAWQADYWWLRKEGFGKRVGRGRHAPKAFQFHALQGNTLIETERWKRLRDRVLDRVHRIVTGVRCGHFPMVNPDARCTDRCPYRTVCRIQHIRALGKSWPTEPFHHTGEPIDQDG